MPGRMWATKMVVGVLFTMAAFEIPVVVSPTMNDPRRASAAQDARGVATVMVTRPVAGSAVIDTMSPAGIAVSASGIVLSGWGNARMSSGAVNRNGSSAGSAIAEMNVVEMIAG